MKLKDAQISNVNCEVRSEFQTLLMHSSQFLSNFTNETNILFAPAKVCNRPIRHSKNVSRYCHFIEKSFLTICTPVKLLVWHTLRILKIVLNIYTFTNNSPFSVYFFAFIFSKLFFWCFRTSNILWFHN